MNVIIVPQVEKDKKYILRTPASTECLKQVGSLFVVLPDYFKCGGLNEFWFTVSISETKANSIKNSFPQWKLNEDINVIFSH